VIVDRSVLKTGVFFAKGEIRRRRKEKKRQTDRTYICRQIVMIVQ